MKTVLFSLLVVVFGLASAPVLAQTTARPGTVLAVQRAPATASQQSYQSNRYQIPSYENRSHMGSIVGSVVGAALGTTVGRGNGRYVAAAASGVIGAAVGNAIDRSADRRRAAREVRAQRRASQGMQVVVKMKQSGRTVAIFVSRGASLPYVGEKVWVVGNNELLPRRK